MLASSRLNLKEVILAKKPNESLICQVNYSRVCSIVRYNLNTCYYCKTQFVFILGGDDLFLIIGYSSAIAYFAATARQFKLQIYFFFT